jgi:hypothetical protein
MKHQLRPNAQVVCSWQCFLSEARADDEETVERPSYNTVHRNKTAALPHINLTLHCYGDKQITNKNVVE